MKKLLLFTLASTLVACVGEAPPPRMRSMGGTLTGADAKRVAAVRVVTASKSYWAHFDGREFVSVLPNSPAVVLFVDEAGEVLASLKQKPTATATKLAAVVPYRRWKSLPSGKWFDLGKVVIADGVAKTSNSVFSQSDCDLDAQADFFDRDAPRKATAFCKGVARVDCQANPNDPSCQGSQGQCDQNSTDPACQGQCDPADPNCVDCQATPNDPACQDPCAQNPNDPQCQDPCAQNPNDPQCQDPCAQNPNDPQCQDPCAQNPNDPQCQDPCAQNPNDPQCQDPCAQNPNDPQCQDPCAQNPNDPQCQDPCAQNPNDPQCQDPCAQNPNDPSCAPQDCQADCQGNVPPGCQDPCAQNPNDPSCTCQDCDELYQQYGDDDWW